MGDALLVGGGVTSPQEARLASSGLLALQGPGTYTVRTGVLVGPGSTALITGTADTGPMTVSIAPHVAVTSRGAANGPYLGPALEATTKVPIGAAPASDARIDVVYVKQQDATTSVSPDPTTAPLWGVLQGQPSAIPVKPDLSTIVGAEELGTVRVAAGATSTNGAGVTITNTARQTNVRGSAVLVPNTDARMAMAGYPSLTVIELDTRRYYVHTGAGWAYLGGGSAPVNAVQIAGGWNSVHNFGVYMDGASRKFLNGWAQNANTFTPTAGTLIGTLPTGFQPTAPRFFAIPVSVGHTVLQVEVNTDRTIKIPRDSGISIGAGAVWDFNAVNFL